MPIISAEQYCAEFESSDVAGCLDRSLDAGEKSLKVSSEIRSFCQSEPPGACEYAGSCTPADSLIDFEICLLSAEAQAIEARMAMIMWILAAVVVAALIAAFWWRRPLGRILGRVGKRVRDTGAP